jgi:bifunctional non-homologous end joining protein LigD
MKSASKNGQGARTLPIKVSHPDKMFWPEEGYTKLDLIEYYEHVFPFLLPYVKDRMLSLERCPDGMLGECFYQKEMPKGMPPGTPGKRIKRSDGSGKITNYVVGGALATQLALVNLGSIALHIMGSRARSPRQPDWVCFDLDPQSEKLSDAVRAALYVKEGLESLDLVAFVKTSGSRGIHVFVPIRVGPDADEVLSFAQEFVARVAGAHSKELTVEHSIAARGDKVYLDPFRNGFGQTVVAPYSIRRRPKAPVSTPLDWSELKATLDPTSFNIRTFAKRLKGKDPWKEFFKSRQSLKDAFRSVKSL